MATNGALVGFDAVRPRTRPLIQRTGRWVRLGLGCSARRGPDQNSDFDERLRRTLTRTHAEITQGADPTDPSALAGARED